MSETKRIEEIKDYAIAILSEARSDKFDFASDVRIFCDELLSEPTIKASELKKFLDMSIKNCNIVHDVSPFYYNGYLTAITTVMDKFCKEQNE